MNIFCITETWLSDDLPSNLFCPKGYEIVRHDRSSRGGGVALLLNCSTSYSTVKIPDEFSDVEIVCTDVNLHGVLCRVIGYYRPPGMTTADIDYALRSVRCLQRLFSTHHPVFLLGDFNLPEVDWSLYHGPDNIVYNTFLDFINSYGLSQLVLSPTRNENILDLILTNNSDIVTNLTTLPRIATSDHNVIWFQTIVENLTHSQSNNCAQTTYIDWPRGNYSAISAELLNINWDNIFQFCRNVNEIWDTFSSIVNECINKHVPVLLSKSVNNSKTRAKCKYPVYIKKLIKTKAIRWKRWKITNCENDKIAYKEAEKNCSRAINKFHTAKETELLRKNNLGSFYKFINSKIKSSHRIESIRCPDGSLSNDNRTKSEIFNNFFASVFTKEDGNKPGLDYRGPPGINLNNVPFTPGIVLSALKTLKPSNSVGPDGIPNVFLKNCAQALCIPLCHIFDSSMKDNVLPSCWRTANVVPIHKKGCILDPNNYRPISLTSTCCKVMEKIINREILSFLIKYNLINENQHGFICNRSTNSNLLECLYDWTQNFEKRIATHIIYCDLRKAFDSVSLSKLLTKLKAYGFTGNILSWLENFLFDRTQRVCIQGQFSSSISVTSGVPQGSVLGPTLFLIFINDLCDHFTDLNIGFKLFADDLKIYSKYDPSSEQDDLSTALSRFSSWCRTWQLEIASDKCYFLPLNALYYNLEKAYNINNHTIKQVEYMKDLGVIIDTNLKYNKHVSDIVHKAMSRVRSILLCFKSRNRTLLKKAFITYVRPLLEYCCCIWSPHYNYLIDNIERVQRYFTKRVPGLWHTSYQDRLEVLNLDTLTHRRNKADLSLTYKIINNYTNTSLITALQPNKHATRGHPYKLLVQYSSIDVRKHFFTNRVIPGWNSLPSQVVCASNVHLFNHYLSKK